MADLKQVAIEALKRNPNVANTPQGQQFLQILQSGDDDKGRQMAKNICQSYNMSEEDAISKVRQFFNL